MNTREWQDARQDLLEEGRRRVGPPPDVEKVEAFLRGDLPEEEAQRVREVLAYYPELVRVMMTEDSSSDATLTDAQREADVASMRQRLGLSSVVAAAIPHRRERSRMFALAAGIIIAVAIGSIALMRWSSEPRPTTTKVLIADIEKGTRGSSSNSAVVLDSGSDYLLKPLYSPPRANREYRLELLDLNATPHRSVWQQKVEPELDGSFPARLSTEDLEPGHYLLVLYGVDEETERLATYSLLLEPR